MAAKKTAGATETCPRCGGDGTVPGGRYTDPERACPRCGGRGEVPVEEKTEEEQG